jgi:2-keto-4-pentenoate hydratase/2-oxohepta-3-ene-1,7-dioic acid hydratase in catechol pathway
MRFGRLRGPDGVTSFARVSGATAYRLDAPPWVDRKMGTDPQDYREVDLICPITPSKIVCIGRNYVAHAKEMQNDVPPEPLLFLKPPSSLLGPNDRVVLPKASTRVEHEAELGIVLGRRARNVTREEALGYVFGYICVCDVTARDLQKKDGQWTRAKGFDTFCPVGPFVETEFDSTSARIQCRVNGEIRQDGSTSKMIFDVSTLIAYVSHVMTLEAGDLLVTGTPEGVGPLTVGDELEVEITSSCGQSLGTLREQVIGPPVA